MEAVVCLLLFLTLDLMFLWSAIMPAVCSKYLVVTLHLVEKLWCFYLFSVNLESYSCGQISFILPYVNVDLAV